ncbi:unnamed protein product, partial [Owenia fusiformis]
MPGGIFVMVYSGKSIGGIDPHLVVLGKFNLFCKYIRENKTETFTWVIRYAGNRDDTQKPIITWTLNGINQMATSDETTPGVLKSTFTKVVGSTDNKKELNCSFRVLGAFGHCSTRLNISLPQDIAVLSGQNAELTCHI